jgi:hypothetical protein
LEKFYKLHDKILSSFEDQTKPHKIDKRKSATPNGEIHTKLCLSVAICYISGPSADDIMLTPEMGKQIIMNCYTVFSILEIK